MESSAHSLVLEVHDKYLKNFDVLTLRINAKKSRIRDTKNLSTYADSRTDTILERLRDLSKKN